MARRKRTIGKKNKPEGQNQEDEVLVDVMQVTEEAGDFIERNQTALFGGLVALVLLIGGWLAYKNFYVQPKQEAALENMWVAENKFAQDSFAVAINNPGGGNLGFSTIESDYGVAEASNAAAYYSAVGFMKLGDFKGAIAYLKDINEDGQLMPVLKNGLLGDAYSEEGDFDNALSYYKKAANGESNEVLTPYYLEKYGMLNEKQGNKAEANKAYARIKNEFPNTISGRTAEKYISRTAG